jgi:hypothetical protein
MAPTERRGIVGQQRRQEQPGIWGSAARSLCALGWGVTSLAGSVAARLVGTGAPGPVRQRDGESDEHIDLTQDPAYGAQLGEIGPPGGSTAA